MKVAKIAPVPIWFRYGIRLPSSAQANPPRLRNAMFIRMSDGTLSSAT